MYLCMTEAYKMNHWLKNITFRQIRTEMFLPSFTVAFTYFPHANRTLCFCYHIRPFGLLVPKYVLIMKVKIKVIPAMSRVR